jgi:hypothetical protein
MKALSSLFEKANQDREDLKQMYNTYFLQVQTLINHKVIEVPELKNFAGSLIMIEKD